ncbi:rho GTPase-activating protein 22 isoform X1 [Scleropages formosus]|uniref:rho GTPase-activating protein 22 isoform X1 n=1 Tax=Scleropages formosus TaxID=113540 RepID=UPI0010FA7E11|nr:rho GTPase-activating protein 22 isoform X1 [Scleropages formosus]
MLSPKIRQTRRARSKSMVMGELSRSGRPCSPGHQERALKAGWLKKQRNIMKNWQLRWFVLRADQLYFYKDEEETKPQGCIPLHGSQVTELSGNPEEPGRHLFEIVPGKAGDSDRGALGHEVLLLMASSHADMEDWVKAIRRVIWAPLGGGIFGQRLEDTMQYEQRFGPREVPRLVEQCVDFIRERGLQEEGLFRLPGQANLVKELQDIFDCGDKPLFNSNTDVHTVASLVKLYLRELPEPVVPFDKYENFLTCAQLLAKDKETGIQELSRQVKTLPRANFNLLKYICKFLDEVQSLSSENKMSVQNLATVFGPNILRPKIEDPVTIMEGTSQVQHLMTVLISEHKQLYAEPDAEPTSDTQVAKTQNQRSMVGWISEEDCSSTGRSIHPSENLCSSAPCLDAIASVPSKLAPQEKAEPAISPSKQTKSLPGWKCSFKGTGKMGGSSVDIPSMSTGSWLMNGLSSLRGHRRTSSGERVGGSGGSGGQNRLSTYDNVSPCSLSVPSVASKAWSTLPPETSAQEISDTKLTSLNYRKEEGLNVQNGEEPPELGNSNGAVDHCATSARGCEINCMTVAGVGDSDGSSEALATRVTELKEELRQQKVAYGTRAKKLETSVAALQAQVQRLQEELDQERKKQRMLEIKLRNSERAHEDAETRNRLLQKEMEEFFSTLGDLTLSSGTGKM